MTLECNTQHTVSLFSFWERGELVSFDSDYSGGDDASLFFLQVSFTSLPVCGGGASGKGFVWTLANW